MVVERDYTAIAAKLGALGPLAESLGATTKGVTFDLHQPLEYLAAKNGVVRGGVADGRPSLARDALACEAILALSGTTNGHLAVNGFKNLEVRTGTRLADLAAEHEGKQITFADTQARPTPVITSPSAMTVAPPGGCGASTASCRPATSATTSSRLPKWSR